MREKDEKEWFEKLGRAIAEECRFNGRPIKAGEKIEHQLGTVWIGDDDSDLVVVSVTKGMEVR